MQGGGSGASTFEELDCSPKSPPSSKKPWEAKEFNGNYMLKVFNDCSSKLSL